MCHCISLHPIYVHVSFHTYMYMYNVHVYILLNCRTVFFKINVHATQCYTVQHHESIATLLYHTSVLFRGCALGYPPKTMVLPTIVETGVYNDDEEGERKECKLPVESLRLKFLNFSQYCHY